MHAQVENLKDTLSKQDFEDSRIDTRLDKLETSVGSMTMLTEQLGEAQRLNCSLREKLENKETLFAEANSTRDSLKSRETSLLENIDSLEAELTAARQNKSDLAMAQESERVKKIQVRLEETLATLVECQDMVKSKDLLIEGMENKQTEIIRQLEDANNKVREIEEHNRDIEKKTRNTEHKIREELTKANLASKEHDRASFEQEKHILRKEKRSAERAIEQLEGQIKTMSDKLVFIGHFLPFPLLTVYLIINPGTLGAGT